MKAFVIISILCLLLVPVAKSDDLYRVVINNPREAQILEASDTDILMSVSGGYLLLGSGNQTEALRKLGLELDLLASGVGRDQLALDGRFDRKNTGIFEILYEEGRMRLLRVRTDDLLGAGTQREIFPLQESHIKIQYSPSTPVSVPDLAVSALDVIQLLIDKVEQDSLESYVHRLEAFGGRLAGTNSNYAARDWIAGKFSEFGYDSISIVPFTGARLWDRVSCQSFNVIACKIGAVFPEQQIIIGGHFDAVPDSPGADDNASGTAATLELARVLRDFETKMTFIFVAFDSEESGLLGAYDYVNRAIENDDHIVLMINSDMIAHHENSNKANLYTGDDTVYAAIWDQVGNAYVGIDADLPGLSASDHWAFQQAGYDVLMVQEKIFSDVYHTSLDRSIYLNFEYMTRMVQATAGMAIAVDQYPPQVRFSSVEEPGDGRTQIVTWHKINSPAIAYYHFVYYPSSNPSDSTAIDFPISDSSYTIDGLIEGEEYCVYVRAYDDSSRTSLKYNCVYFTPRSKPESPYRIVILPLKEAVNITWRYGNSELDFDHIAIMRDGEVVAETLDSSFVDNAVSLGGDMHAYRVIAVDAGGTCSDTMEIEPYMARAATFGAGRILAVNRTHVYSIDFVDETETGVFLREALAEYDFDYYSDTAAITCDVGCVPLKLNDFLDYDIVVVGAETARWEDLAVAPIVRGILDSLAYYMSIGGKALIFGRWGNIGGSSMVDYTTTVSTHDDVYHDFFHVESRRLMPTPWDYVSTFVPADLIGARSTVGAYPYLPWDSAATVAHSASQNIVVTEAGGIPCATFAVLDSSKADVIYTYDSRGNDVNSEGQPVAWRYFGDDYSYVFFDVPLSFFDRASAVAAVRQAVTELLTGVPEQGGTPDGPPGGDLPSSYTLSQNYPNPFNPATAINFSLPKACQVKLEIFNILGQRVTRLIDSEMEAGEYTVYWDGRGVASGIYLYRLNAGDFVSSKKMMLIK